MLHISRNLHKILAIVRSLVGRTKGRRSQYRAYKCPGLIATDDRSRRSHIGQVMFRHVVGFVPFRLFRFDGSDAFFSHTIYRFFAAIVCPYHLERITAVLGGGPEAVTQYTYVELFPC